VELRRLLLFAGAGGLAFAIIDLAPRPLYGFAFLSILVLGVVTGVLSRSYLEIAALSAGALVGGFISGAAQFGTENAPDSVQSLLFGALVTVGILFAIAAATRFLGRRRQLPHGDPELEQKLPSVVGGRSLTRWSLRGEAFLASALGLDQNGLDALSVFLRSKGVDMANVSMGVAGRSRVSDAPPYFVYAYRFAGVPASEFQSRLEFPLGFGLRPDAGSFGETNVAGRTVLKGVVGMLDQDEHLRGVPYIYESGDIRFVIVTDSEAWAADALSQL